MTNQTKSRNIHSIDNITSEVEYHIVDKNRLLTIISTWKSSKDAINALLNEINNSLNILINNNIKLQTNVLNFDNFECVVCKNKLILNVYKFNHIDNTLYDINNNIYSLDNSRYRYALINIKAKFTKLNPSPQSPIPTNELKTINKPVQENPIKHLFKDINETVKKVTNHQIDFQRKIPTVKSQAIETDENSSEDIQETKDIDLDNIVQPNIQRPMNSIVTERKQNHNDMTVIDNNEIEIDIEELTNTYNELQKLKELEQIKLNDLKEITKKDIDNFSDYCDELGDKKRKLRRDKEKEEERRNKYDANKYAYKKMKSDISNGKMNENEISELFTKEYPIYKFMDQMQLLDKDDGYNTYLNLYNEMYPDNNDVQIKKGHVPHNINYLSGEEQDKYTQANNDNDMLKEFFNKIDDPNVTKKNYPSLEKVLESVDNDDNLEINTNDVCFDIENNDNEIVTNTFDQIENALKLTMNDETTFVEALPINCEEQI